MSKPNYICHKCGRGSYANGGLPICCFCGAKPKPVAK